MNAYMILVLYFPFGFHWDIPEDMDFLVKLYMFILFEFNC